MTYQPELGQFVFGQPWQKGQCPQNVKSALSAMSDAWDVLRDSDNPFSNTGARFDGVAFKAHAYSWDDDECQEFNFAWRDLRVSWYKYLGRGMSANRDVSDAEAREMLAECMKELMQ